MRRPNGPSDARRTPAVALISEVERAAFNKGDVRRPDATRGSIYKLINFRARASRLAAGWRECCSALTQHAAAACGDEKADSTRRQLECSLVSLLNYICIVLYKLQIQILSLCEAKAANPTIRKRRSHFL